MEKIINSRSFFFIYLIILVISLTGLSMDSVNWRTLRINSPYVSLYQLSLFICGVTICYTNLKKYHDSLSNIIGWFCFACLISTILNSQIFHLKYIIAMLFNVFVIPLGISSGKYLIDNISTIKHSQIILIILQIPAILVGNTLIGLDFKFNSDCAFAIFLYMPLIFFLKSNIIKIIFIAFYGFVILLAGKRSIFIAYSTSLAIYLIYVLFFINKNKLYTKKTKYFILATLVIGVIWIINNSAEQIEYISTRFSNIDKDGGSGRDIVYATVLSAFERSSILQIFFGHGYQSVVNTFQIGAHNDLLQIVYEYGLVPLALYISFLIKLSIYAVKNFRPNTKNGNYSYVFAISTSIIIILGMLNCMVASTIFGFINYLVLGMSLQTILTNRSYV